jgi:hypothetical protein
MTTYNPHAPSVIGLEWLASRQRWDPLSRTVGRGALVTFTSGLTLNALRTFLRWERGPTTNVTITAEVYSDPRAAPVASGTAALQNTATAGAWLTVPLSATLTPTVGLPWLIVLRLTNDGYGVSWAALDATTTWAHETDTLSGQVAVEVPLDPVTFRPTAAYATPQLDTAARSLVLLRPDASIHPDSQVYADSPVYPVSATRAAQQTLTPGSDLSVGQVYALVMNDASASRWPYPLVMTVSGPGLAQDRTATVNTSSLTSADGKWHRLHAVFDPPLALTGGSSYTIRFTSIAPDLDPWEVTGLSAVDTGLASATFGGAAMAGPTTAVDLQTAVEALLAAPTGVALGSVMLDTSRDLLNCVVPRVQVPLLEWAATHPLGDKLARYEVERNDDGTWRPVAAVTRSDVYPVFSPPYGPTAFLDVEALRNAQVLYRVRAVSTDGVASAWTTVGPITLVSDEPDVLLASNWRTDLTWAGMDEPGYTWEPVDASRLATRMLYGRNMQMGFREPEYRGDKFDRSLIVAFNDPNMPRIPDVPAPPPAARYAPPGRVQFDPLLAIAHARDVPYVTFLDAKARRWYTAPAVTGLHEDEPQQQYRADATFIEVSDQPLPAVLPYLPPVVTPGAGWDYATWDTDVWEATP